MKKERKREYGRVREKKNKIQSERVVSSLGFSTTNFYFTEKQHVRLHLEINSKASGAENNLKFMYNQRQNKYQNKSWRRNTQFNGIFIENLKISILAS